MDRYYRIHSAFEPLDTLLNPSRPDGWVASDEGQHGDVTQPLGIPCCESLDDLARYVVHSGMAIGETDVFVELVGSFSGEDDRDQWATRCVATGARSLGLASEWATAWSIDLDVLAADLEYYSDDPEYGDPLEDLAPGVRAWLAQRVESECDDSERVIWDALSL